MSMSDILLYMRIICARILQFWTKVSIFRHL